VHSKPYNQSQTSREAVQLRRVHTLTDRFSMANTYLVDEERLFVIDPCSVRNVHLLFKYVTHILHRPIHDIDLIVLTHLHPDHKVAAEALRNLCDAPIAAPAGVQPSLTQRQKRKGISAFSYTYKHQTHEISIWLHDVEGLPNHLDWRVITSPGPTGERLCLYNPFTRELLSGNTIFTIRGKASLVRGNTNPALLREIIETLRNLPISYLYPGHGRAILSHHPLSNLNVE